MKHGLWLAAILIIVTTVLTACGGGGGGGSDEPAGSLTVNVTQAGSGGATKVEGARVTILDGATGDVVNVLTTNANGTVSTELPPGQVLLKVAAQGYAPSPSPLGAPLPITIQDDRTTPANIQLDALSGTATLGALSGKVLASASTGLANALVVATDGSAWYSTATAPDGSYTFFNLPAGSYTVTALRTGYNFPDATPMVTASLTTPGINFVSAGAATATISGVVTFLASANGVVDVTLLHPQTGEVIPGLSTDIDASTRAYTLANVPDGTYVAIASLKTDGYVLDPDAVAKFGEPKVTVQDGVAYPFVDGVPSDTPDDLNFDVTDAVTLLPTEIAAGTVTFKWSAYPSTKNYVLAVTDENGNLVWGGKVPVVGSDYTVGTATQATYPAEAPALNGTYRVRVYACVDENTAPFYTVISASEDLEGIFTVVP